jgi:hypothetical protein
MMNFTDYYNGFKDNPNNISFWYPKIKDCGILTPNTYITDIPEEVLKACFMEGNQQECIDTVYNWVKNELMPNLPNELRGLLFIKNGAFSNKFDFNTACARYSALDIARSIIEINYASLMFETGGNAEIAIRERIVSNEYFVPCIYNGMPFQNEYRIFYNFDTKKALYIVNYWDWKYCYDAISRNITDKLVYECYYGRIQEHFEENRIRIMQYVEEHMQNVTGLEGIWSIDIMEANGNLWLIDMALGHCSAYWDPVLAGIEF